MNDNDNVSDRPNAEKSASRRRKASRMNRPRLSSAKNRGKTNQQQQQQQQQQRTGSGMRGGRDGSSNRSGGSSSAPQLHRDDSIAMSAANNTSDGEPLTAGHNTTNSFLQEEKDGRRRNREKSTKTTGGATGVPPEASHEVCGASGDETQRGSRLLQQLKSRNEEIESRRRHLEQRCTQLEVEASSKHAELKTYKAEVRAKTIAVGKAEIILNDVCLSMARRVGRAEGVQVSESKNGVMLEGSIQDPWTTGAVIQGGFEDGTLGALLGKNRILG